MVRTPAVPLLLGAVALVVAVSALAPLGFGWRAISTAGALYLLLATIITTHFRQPPPWPAFGMANAVTLARAIAGCLFGGVAAMLTEGAMPPEWASGACALGVAALAADGLDGWLARRFGTASDFGARFDMETDAFLILVWSIIVWQTGKAGPWVLASGAARYLYVAAGVVLPGLRRPLFESFRRKVIAVIQGATLVALLSPIIVPPFSDGLALMALVLLLYSFAADIRWQLADARTVPTTIA